MLEIKDIHVDTEGKEILKGLSLAVKAGECHAIMGPNGAGKSTLAKVLAGHPSYEMTKGEILFKGNEIQELSPEERAHAGLFMSFQYPVEIAGVSNLQFLHASHSALQKAKGTSPLSLDAFEALFEEKSKEIGIKREFKERAVNEGFSGGEKKKNEILQMAMLDPDFAILDETDSGLDIDALRAIAEAIELFRKKGKGLLLITHYQRLLEYVKPDKIHVMIDGKVALSGEADLAHTLEKKGYDWLREGK